VETSGLVPVLPKPVLKKGKTGTWKEDGESMEAIESKDQVSGETTETKEAKGGKSGNAAGKHLNEKGLKREKEQRK
jgi:hypothetical protein